MERGNKKWKPAEGFFEKLILLLAAILFYLVLLHLDAVGAALGRFLHILLPFAEGAALAYLLDLLARPLERHGFRSRKAAVIASVVLAALLLTLLLRHMLPQLWQSLVLLIRNVPYYYDRAIAYLNKLAVLWGAEDQSVVEFLRQYRDTVTDASRLSYINIYQLAEYGGAIGSGVVNAVMAVTAAVYMLLDKAKLQRQMRKVCYVVLPKKQADFVCRVSKLANRMCRGFLEGKCIDSLVIGGLTWLVLLVLHIPYANLIAIVVGVTNIVPIAGPILGAAPCAVILVLEDPMDAVKFLAAILVIQQLDGKVIGPRILGERTGLSTLWVLIALVVGGRVAGAPGMLLGVPLVATLRALCSELLLEMRQKKNIDENGQSLSPAAAAGQGSPDSAAAAAKPDTADPAQQQKESEA